MSTPSDVLQSLLDPPHYSAARMAAGKALSWRHRALHRRRRDDVVLERIAGRPLLVTPSVFNPRLMRTGEFFARQLRPPLLRADAEVLDMGTGSGVCAVHAAAHVRRVVAVDINPAAVRCTLINALINGLDNRIEVLHGDLFEPLEGRRFDVILFNPPFLQGVPRDDADRAWRSIDVAERFAAELRRHLRPAGYALLLLSNYGGASEFWGQLRRRGLAMTVVAQKSYINEKLTLLKVDVRES